MAVFSFKTGSGESPSRRCRIPQNKHGAGYADENMQEEDGYK